MSYLDSSALLKLLFEESESAALALWISEQTGAPMVTSELAKVDVVRAARRLDADVAPAAKSLMSHLGLYRSVRFLKCGLAQRLSHFAPLMCAAV